MKKPTRLVQEDAYEEMASSYQCLQVSILDAALRENGIADPDVRRKVCESYLFSVGQFHDEGWLKTEASSEPVYPLLCFSRRPLNADHSIDHLGDVFAPSEMFAFHEYAMGNASLLYEGDPNAVVETGTGGRGQRDPADVQNPADRP